MTAGPAVPTGNTFDKYGSTNPVVRRLMAGFQRTLDELFAEAAPESVLDVGCGEGVLTEQWAQALGDGRVVGIDLDDPKLAAEWATRAAAEPAVRGDAGRVAVVRRRRVRSGRRHRGARARRSSRGSGCRDGPRRPAVAAGVGSPRATVASAERRPRRLPARAGQHARAISTTGPAPASSRCSAPTARSCRRVRRSPGRCCLSEPDDADDAERALVRVGRTDPVDRDRVDRDLHLRLPGDLQPRPLQGRLRADLALLVDHVRDPVGDLPADRAVALTHDRRSPRPRAERPSAADPGRDPVSVSRSSSSRSR